MGVCRCGTVAERKACGEHPAHGSVATYLHSPARVHPLAVSDLVRRVVYRLEAGGEALGKRAAAGSAALALPREVLQRAGRDRPRGAATAARVHRANAAPREGLR